MTSCFLVGTSQALLVLFLFILALGIIKLIKFIFRSNPEKAQPWQNLDNWV